MVPGVTCFAAAFLDETFFAAVFPGGVRAACLVACLVAGFFFAGDLRAAGFFVAGCLEAAFVTAFFVAFLVAGVLFAAGLRTAVFFAAVLLVAAFLAAALLEEGTAAGFFAADWRAGLFAGSLPAAGFPAGVLRVDDVTAGRRRGAVTEPPLA